MTKNGQTATKRKEPSNLKHPIITHHDHPKNPRSKLISPRGAYTAHHKILLACLFITIALNFFLITLPAAKQYEVVDWP